MRTAAIAVAGLALCLGGYWATLPDFPPLVGVTRIGLEGPLGRLREVTEPDTVARIVALAERHYPRWHSWLFPRATGGPLLVTFYRGNEPVRWVRVGDAAIVSCADDTCVGKRVSVSVVRELVDLLRVPRRLVEVPVLDPAT